jgi:hypothetical protein
MARRGPGQGHRRRGEHRVAAWAPWSNSA